MVSMLRKRTTQQDLVYQIRDFHRKRMFKYITTFQSFIAQDSVLKLSEATGAKKKKKIEINVKSQNTLVE